MSKLFNVHSNGGKVEGWNIYRPKYTLVISEETRTIGVAVCSRHDQYSRKKGVSIARRRMLNHKATEHRRTMGDRDWLIVAPDLRYSHENDPLPRILSELRYYQPENITILRTKVKNNG